MTWDDNDDSDKSGREEGKHRKEAGARYTKESRGYGEGEVGDPGALAKKERPVVGFEHVVILVDVTANVGQTCRQDFAAVEEVRHVEVCQVLEVSITRHILDDIRRACGESGDIGACNQDGVEMIIGRGDHAG